jgi:hypothetical protein
VASAVSPILSLRFRWLGWGCGRRRVGGRRSMDE